MLLTVDGECDIGWRKNGVAHGNFYVVAKDGCVLPAKSGWYVNGIKHGDFRQDEFYKYFTVQDVFMS